MKQYNVKCPVCGTVNKDLFLDETEGWMECEYCHTVTMSGKYAQQHLVRIPLLNMAHIIHCPATEAVK